MILKKEKGVLYALDFGWSNHRKIQQKQEEGIRELKEKSKFSAKSYLAAVKNGKGRKKKKRHGICFAEIDRFKYIYICIYNRKNM